MKSSGRILIAISDENTLLNTSVLLQREGYQCTLARNGFEAFRALEANEYDLLIAESKMPDNEELELVRIVRQYAPGMPVIIYTGQPSLRSAIASIQLCVAAYLIKPVEFSILLHHVKLSIANYRHFKMHGSEDKMKQISRLTSAIEETIQVLQSTKSSFKSKKLAALRRKLERLIAGEKPETDEGSQSDD